jgi:hypothetical protein
MALLISSFILPKETICVLFLRSSIVLDVISKVSLLLLFLSLSLALLFPSLKARPQRLSHQGLPYFSISKNPSLRNRKSFAGRVVFASCLLTFDNI